MKATIRRLIDQAKARAQMDDELERYADMTHKQLDGLRLPAREWNRIWRLGAEDIRAYFGGDPHAERRAGIALKLQDQARRESQREAMAEIVTRHDIEAARRRLGIWPTRRPK